MYQNNHDPYQAIHRNTGTLPRTMSRVDDAYTIQTFKSDTKHALDFFGEAIVGFLYVATISALVYAVLTWLR